MSADKINSAVGRISRVNGPIVEARGMAAAGMLEVVEVGNLRLVGEVIRLNNDLATIQTYEHTGGIKPGDPVYCTQMPLSVSLGPGIIGTIYDGIQRPLNKMFEGNGFYIGRGDKPPSLDQQRRWDFAPQLSVGASVGAGQAYGTVPETVSIIHKLMIPPRLSGTVTWIAAAGAYCVNEPICRICTAAGTEQTLSMSHNWPVRKPRPTDGRIALTKPLVTGQRVIDTFFPIAQGGAAAIPGGFGTGKTMTQQALAKWSAAQVIVYIGCGERGNEMTDVLHEFRRLIDPRTRRSMMERTVLIANTSNMPVAAREVCIYTGITIAEYYRDMGYSVAIMADSTSRWAEALRELSGRLEEMPADEGFPAYLPSRLAEFYERAGHVKTLGGDDGSVSIIGAVSPPGGDFSEPVTQHTSRLVRCFWALDRELASSRHYPAMNWLDSYSEYIDDIRNWWRHLDPQWQQNRNELMQILQEEVNLQRIAKLVGPDALPDGQRLILYLAEMIKNAYLQQNSFDPVDTFCSATKQTRMLRVLVLVKTRCEELIHLGATLADIRAIAALNQVVRMKSQIDNEDTVAFTRLSAQVNLEFDEVARSLR